MSSQEIPNLKELLEIHKQLMIAYELIYELGELNELHLYNMVDNSRRELSDSIGWLENVINGHDV